MPPASRYVAPRWVELLQDSLNQSMSKDPGQIAFALASASDSGPRVRMVVHRGFLNERRPNEDLGWSENPAVDGEGHPWTSSSMLVTTDVRCVDSRFGASRCMRGRTLTRPTAGVQRRRRSCLTTRLSSCGGTRPRSTSSACVPGRSSSLQPATPSSPSSPGPSSPLVSLFSYQLVYVQV